MARTWLITGTSRGFGRAWAEAALERGDRVVGTARDTRTNDDLVATYTREAAGARAIATVANHLVPHRRRR